MKKYCLLLLVTLLSSTNPSFSKANENPNQATITNIENSQDTKKTLTKKQTHFRIGVSYVNSYPLFSYADVEDKGLGWAILKKFAEAKNITFEYLAMPVNRLQPSMDSEAIDFIFPDNPLWSVYRSNRLPNIYSAPIINTVSASFVRTENSDINITDVSKVAIPFGYTAYTWVSPIKDYNIKSVPVRDLYTALYSVQRGSVVVADVEYNIGVHLIAESDSLHGLSIAPNLPNTSVAYHLSSIKHITLLEELSAFIEKERELIENLRQKYGIKYHHEVFTNTKAVNQSAQH